MQPGLEKPGTYQVEIFQFLYNFSVKMNPKMQEANEMKIELDISCASFIAESF